MKRKITVSFEIEDYYKPSLVNWKWIKKEAIRDIFEPYAKVKNIKIVGVKK